MLTLHGYVLRELLKTFALTAIGLTILFTLGGGLFNLVKFDGLSTQDLLKLLPMLLPFALTLMMPVAALFAATIVYGRFAADNELTAVRAAGINVHRLFLSAILLSVFVTLSTLLFANYVVPGLLRQMTLYVSNNLRDLAAQKLRTDGYLKVTASEKGDKYFMTGTPAPPIPDDLLVERGFPRSDRNLEYLRVDDPTFLQLDADGVVLRFTTAEAGLCQFDTRGSAVKITVFVSKASDYEIGRMAAFVEQQQIGPVVVPFELPEKEDWVDLNRLLELQRAPWQAHKLPDALRRFRNGILAARFDELIAGRSAAHETVTLPAGDAELVITADRAVSVGGGRPTLYNARVEVRRPDEGLPVRYEAAEADLVVNVPEGRFAARDRPPEVQVRLRQVADEDVKVFVPHGGRYGKPERSGSLTLPVTARLPTALTEDVAAIPDAALVNLAVPLPLNEKLSEVRAKLARDTAERQRRITSLIHFRLSFASSTLVTVIMGAALGVIFRGARALAAFGLACIPFGIALVLILMGRSLTRDELTYELGPIVIWGGLAAVLVADVFILRLGVKR